MKSAKINFIKLFSLTILFVSIYLTGCNNDNVTENSSMTDDDYLSSAAINTAFSSNADDDDNLFSNETGDFDSQGAVAGTDTPVDSVLRWGRRITGTNVSTNITNSGDSLKNVEVTRNISGDFIMVGYINGNLDSTVKPFTQEQKRIVIFKRVGNRPNPRLNWRVFRHSAIDGQTRTPQVGKDNIVMNKIEIYKNGNLVLTLNGGDFTTNMFNARLFNENGPPESATGEQLRIKVYATSSQQDSDIVSYHWPRNISGHHRENFIMTSQIQNGNNFDRTYEKTFEIYSQHNHGIHNGFISANTRSSFYDNSTQLFSSTYMGFPYRVRR